MQPEDSLNNTTFRFDAFDLADRMLEQAPAAPVRPEGFGPYRFPEDQPRGQGSLGDVWLAEEHGELGAERRVAIKLLRGISRPDLAANEVKSQAKLEHRYIARLYNHGVLQDGTPWLAMEFVDGQPLDEYCRSRNCPIDRRLAIFHAVCEAVQYAHLEKVDHGDLKPSNILVKQDGEPKLVDFGLARRLHELADSSSQAPVAGLTPAYAAPEQFRGESPGFRSDIYSLGVILYELLCGELPFDPSKNTLLEMASLKSGTRKPEAPSAVARRTNRDGQLSEAQWRDLDALCLKAMESDVNKRYPSVESLLRDLDRYLRCQPLAARMPHTRAYLAGKFLRRNRRAVAAASAVFVLIAGIVGFFTFRLANERNKALAEAARTRSIQRFMLDLFGNGDQQAAPSKDLTVLAAADRWAAGLASLRTDPETEAELYLTLGRVYAQLNQLPKAESFLRSGLEKSKALGAETRRTMSALVQFGSLRGDQAQFPEAERLFHEALDLARRLHLAADDPLLVNAQAELGKVLIESAAYDKAIALLEPIVRRPASGEEAMVNLQEAISYLAVAEQYTGHYDTSESLNRRALEMDRKLHGNSHPRVGYDLTNIATTEMTLGHYPQAEDLYGEAVHILEAWYGPENVDVVQIRGFIALAEMQTGHNAEAEKLLRILLPLQERAYGTSVHPSIAFTHDSLGKLASNKGNLAEAEAEYRLSIEINEKMYGLGEYKTALSITNLAGILLKEGKYGEAERTIRPAVKALTAQPLPGNMGVGVAQLNLGEAILRQKRYQEAVEPLSAAYEILKNGPSTTAPRLQQVRGDLVETYEALKRPDLAASFQAR